MSNKLESKINQIIRSAPLSSEYDTELYIHDYIVNSCEYLHTSGPEERTVIGSLINSKANCSGYAKAVKILLNRLNIKCILVVGRADNFVDEPQNHMWNIVRIGGKYYHLDATWDDPTGAADNDGSRRVFFNMSDSMIKRTHSEINVKIKCPEDDKYFYRVSERYFTDYTDSVRLKMAHALAVAADAGERSVDFVFASKGAYEKAKKDLITSERIYRIPELANVEAKRKLVTDRVSYSTDDELFILVLVIQYD